MLKYIFIFSFFISSFASAQNSIQFTILDSINQEPLIGATALIKGTQIGASADDNGFIKLDNIPNGNQVIIIQFVGYKSYQNEYNFPLRFNEFTILLNFDSDELDEIIVEGTRSNRSMDDIPTRVEVLTEEIDEASTMDPSKVAHLLTHSTGIQVQQTSATSNSANVRIQGLDGRYTQILKDGFPIYGGFSGSLSIMQIPPLDLRQIEYVKGSSSTLYGAGAISGLINLLSKEPVLGKDEKLIHLNISQVGAMDVNVFTSSRDKKFGYTLLAQRNSHQFFDANKDGFSDLPSLLKYNFNPRFFIYFNDKTKMYIGGTFTNETRKGGDIQAFDQISPDSLNFYQEKNDINRITTQVKFDRRIGTSSMFTIKNSFNYFNRELNIYPDFNSGNYRFAGQQLSSFSEITFTNQKEKNCFITGLNLYSDDFKETPLMSLILRNEQLITAGFFINYTFDLGKKVSIESGIRTDYTFENDFHLLPRVSALFKWTAKLTTRIGGGMGYRNASIFNQEAEILGYKNVLAIDYSKVKAEESFGGNADIGYKTTLGENFFIHFNQMFFFTKLNAPLVLVDTNEASGIYEFVNANGFTQTYGAETFFKFGFYDFVLFVGYTYTNATHHFNDSTSTMVLTPTHSLKGDLLYALPGKWRIGADYEFKSGQTLSSGRITPSFWTYGLVIEYTNKQFTFFSNFENFTNYRQTKMESLNSLPYSTPQFTEVWAPLDGFVFNAGIKIRL
jgi:iron complex outermembrane receptor protein